MKRRAGQHYPSLYSFYIGILHKTPEFIKESPRLATESFNL
jgi:hypothetical protein